MIIVLCLPIVLLFSFWLTLVEGDLRFSKLRACPLIVCSEEALERQDPVTFSLVALFLPFSPKFPFLPVFGPRYFNKLSYPLAIECFLLPFVMILRRVPRPLPPSFRIYLGALARYVFSSFCWFPKGVCLRLSSLAFWNGARLGNLSLFSCLKSSGTPLISPSS